ncbi:heavy-metal-associated domain-containing protein [Pseudomonas fluorescens]|jgi:copper chaperone|uniref:heavy-metal-associated domain-containing protein n=1 Tax=Pseudomonas fluorescens TaxID=294 RepID=UPI001784AF2D|nr:cation transporter [Pseudomonas fluorescens]MBD8100649.1 heavy-metal-associated domain-containing protein [Pseudomonas fluorescens]MBD8777272.1 heavy-metal-associated domain-containing protein [Pseudomonas fluorescens]MBD8782412.1 heavy-metal-associated domain-containing protein [Pseudomonas fluorescens]MBD8798675.1 heavy-metal-associated domain-containing protein [Pseudomonas fluorescens]
MQIFNVEGMTCGHCVRAVTQAVRSQDADAEVTVDLAAKQVRVQSQLEREAIAQLIKEEGYTVV